MTIAGDYVLGTHDAEIARLALQHRVWRPRVLDAWRRAGFTVDQRIADIGCGPGNATLDLADIVGPAGRILAVDRSPRFIDVLHETSRLRGTTNIVSKILDLDHAGDDALPAGWADGAWCRWVLAFVTKPREVLAHVHRLLRPGGVLVVHEYIDYGAWRLAPGSETFEEFVRAVMASWRAAGGEPDIGLQLPAWLSELDFDVREVRPIVDCVEPANYTWHWGRAFVEVGLARLVELGHFTRERADAIWQEFLSREAEPHTRMVTPIVAEFIAVRR